MKGSRAAVRGSLAGLALAVGLSLSVQAAPCARDDPASRVTGDTQCIALRIFRAADAGVAPVLVVVIHGDIVGGGVAASHYPVAEAIARTQPDVVVAALLRPGYADGAGRASSGASHGHIDNYTALNVDEMAGAIAKLKAHHKARRSIVVGFSGGGAFAALLIGRHPGLLDDAVVIACPCDIKAWRATRPGRAWTRSESPIDYVERVPPATRVAVITGSADWLTPPWLAAEYAARLAARGVAARAEIVPGATHTSVFRHQTILQAVGALLAPP